MTDEEKELQELHSEDFRNQTARFYNEIKRKNRKYVEGFRPLIKDGTMKVKGLTQQELDKCLTEALGKHEVKNAERSARENRRRYH